MDDASRRRSLLASPAMTRVKLACVVLLGTLGCGDDVSSASGSEGSSSSTAGTTSMSEETSTSAETSTPGSSTSTASDTTGTSGDASSTTASSSAGVSSSGSDSSGDGSSSGDSSSSSSGGEGKGIATVCEEGGEFVLGWGLQVPGGTFPDDIPSDLIATCDFAPSLDPTEIPIACAEVVLLFTIESTPVLTLPTEPQQVDVRLHRAPGPLGFPDIWAELAFYDGPRVFVANSSVLDPASPTIELPYDMVLSEEECGPYNIGTPLEPKDNCGDQMWHGVELDLDEDATVFHGTHLMGSNEGDEVGVWVQTARDYGKLPQFCDIPVRFFSFMVVSETE